MTYQSSNVFNGLGSSTYTVITRDSATPTNNTLSNTVTVSSNGLNANYTIGVVVDNVVNTSSSTQIATWKVQVTPPLPVGTAISFYLSVNDIKSYYSPGTGTINGTTVVKKNNVTVTTLAGQSSQPLTTTSRPGCSPNTLGVETFTQSYYLTIGNGDVVSGTSTSILTITDGQVGSNSCVTKLEQSILVNTVSAIINGGVCNTVTNNPQSQGISYHSLSNTVSTQTVPMAVTYNKINTCSRVIGSIKKQGYGSNLFTINAGQSVGTTATTIVVNTSDVLLFDFTTLSLTPACAGIPIQSNDMTFSLERNGVAVYTDNISSPGSNNNLNYSYIVPAGTNSLTIDIDSDVS
jgi:hypothetical protein